MKKQLLLFFLTLSCLQTYSQAKCKVLWGEMTLKKAQGCLLESHEKPVTALIQIQSKINKNMKQENLNLKLKVKNRESLNGLQVRFLESGNIMFQYDLPLFQDSEFNVLQDNIASQLTIPFSQLVAIGERNKNPIIDEVQFYIDVKNKSFELQLLNQSWDKKESKNGAVSLTFDDGYASQMKAAQIMRKHNMAGVAYLIPEAVDKANYLSSAQIAQLKKWDWDLSSHYQTPMTELNNTSRDPVILQIIKNVKKYSTGESHQHFAYPMGRYNKDVLLNMKRHFKTARLASGGFETLPVADVLRLRAINVTPSLKAEELIKMAQDAIENGDWAIFMFHYIDESGKKDLNYSSLEFEKFVKGIDKQKKHVKTITKLKKEISF